MVVYFSSEYCVPRVTGTTINGFFIDNITRGACIIYNRKWARPGFNFNFSYVNFALKHNSLLTLADNWSILARNESRCYFDPEKSGRGTHG